MCTSVRNQESSQIFTCRPHFQLDKTNIIGFFQPYIPPERSIGFPLTCLWNVSVAVSQITYTTNGQTNTSNPYTELGNKQQLRPVLRQSV